MSESRRLFLGDIGRELPAIQVGRFTLEAPVGQGSMGEVWRGTHVEQDVEVAVKVILSEHARKKRSHRAFRQEVRSMAELKHPFIVDVYDYGTVDETAESNSLGQLQAGSPYLVMEYAAHGSLGDRAACSMDWELTRLVVLSVLDALAHSHARGVLHRDVKPQNILLANLEDGPGIKLTDFGLAYALRATQEVANWHHAAGTPQYMAPEQITGDWRHYGPSTDLYALGCVTYELLTGYAPFGGDNIVQIARAHLEDSLPPLPEDCKAPTGLEDWLRTLMAKESGDRFKTAADAGYALRQIDDIPVDNHRLHHAWRRLVAAIDSDSTSDKTAWADSMTPLHSLDVLVRAPSLREKGDSKDRDATDSTRPIPLKWTRSGHQRSARRMIGTGRGLFDMRRLPFFGRRAERDCLWERLRGCADDNKLATTLVSGPSGVGKSFLVRWFCDRVGELGAAQVFRSHQEATDEVIDHIASMIRRRFSLAGQSRDQIEEFFSSMLGELGAEDPYEWQALTELIHSSDDPSAPSKIHFTSPTQRRMVYVRFFERLSQHGPVLLWLNDVHWGLSTLHFVETLIHHPTLQAPIYVVMTGRDDLLPESSPHRECLESILDSPHANHLKLAPLDEQTLRQLVKEALFLDPSAAYEVTQRANGNPRHALAIVGDWIDRDLLEADSHGYTLREDACLDTPGDWTSIWSRAVQRLTGGCDNRQIVLELGAILGERFNREVWKTAAQMMKKELPDELVETLLKRKYLVLHDEELAFTQNWLREALFASAREQGRWEDLCEVCARALDEHAPSQALVDERVGFLLLEAGRPLKGVQRLLAALEHYHNSRDYQAMLHLSQHGLQALEDCTPCKRIRRQEMKLRFHLAHSWHNLGANDRSLRASRRAAELADEFEEGIWRGIAARYIMVALYITGDIEGAKNEAQLVEDTLADHPDYRSIYAQALLTSSHIAMMEDEYDRAIEFIDKARRAVSQTDDAVVQCQVEYVRTKALILRGQMDSIDSDYIESLVQKCLDAGATTGGAHSANLGGEVARRRGDLKEARRWYQRSMDLFRLVEPDLTFVPRQNLALIALEAGKLSVAGRRAEAVLQQLRRVNRPQIALHALSVKLPMLVVRGDDIELKTHLDEIESIIEELGFGSDRDVALGLRIAREKMEQKKPQDALHQQLVRILAHVEP